MVCCSDSEYEEEVITIMTRADDKAEEEITDEVQEDSPSFSNTDQGLECDEHDSAGNIYCLSFTVKTFSFRKKTFAVTSFYSIHMQKFA